MFCHTAAKRATNIPAIATRPLKSNSGIRPNGLKRHLRIARKRNSANREQDAQLGGTNAGTGKHGKSCASLSPETPRPGDQWQVADQHTQSDDRVHVGGAGQPGEQHRGADDVEHVIDVVAVTRLLDEADTCEGAIEVVAEPVHGQRHDDHPDRAQGRHAAANSRCPRLPSRPAPDR